MTGKKVSDVVVRNHAAFNEFVATIEALRAEDGCPWDREQSHQSIANNMIEEAYEAVDAIERKDVAHLREELGDVLLQVVLQSQIASDAGEFTIDDVCADVNEKMVRRHPHVFGQAHAENANEVLDLWDKVKLAERADGDSASREKDLGDESPAGSGEGLRPVAAGGDGSGLPIVSEGLLDGVPRSFPALMQAQKISRKAAAVGFEWDTVDDVWDKVSEEIAELKSAYAEAPKSTDGKVLKDADPLAACAVEMEMGDVLFSLVNIARRMGVHAESALRAACLKFRDRWAFIEGAAWGQGRRVEDLSSEELEDLWQMAKSLYETLEPGSHDPKEGEPR